MGLSSRFVAIILPTASTYIHLNGFVGQEAASRGTLNLGIKDQLVALEWINKNIGAFGGDSERVIKQSLEHDIVVPC